MSLKELPGDINFQTVKRFRKLLADNKKMLAEDKQLIDELFSLKEFIEQMEISILAKRAKTAAEALSSMSEEQRRMLNMTNSEREFYLQYKLKHPDNPWMYVKEYQKKLEKAYKLKQKKIA